MKVQIEELSQVARKVQVELPAEMVSEELEKAYKELKKRAQLRGFRPGKAPRFLLERYFGEQVRDQVSSQLIEDSFGRVLSEHELRAVGRPRVEEVDLKPGQEMRYTVMVEVLPRIELGEYKGLELPEMEVNVTDEDISARIEEIREMFARLEDLEEERPAQEGDFALLRTQTWVGEERIGPPQGDEQLVELREGSLDERVYKAVLGLRPGEEVRVPYSFDADHRDPKLAGKEGILEVKLEKLRKKVLPELDDAFAQRLGEYSDLEQLRAGIRAELEEEQRRRIEAQASSALVDQLLKLHDFEVPETLVALQMESMLRDATRRMMLHGLREKEARSTLAQMRERYRDSAVRAVRSSLILQAIAEKEGLEVTDEVLRRSLERIARETGRDLSQVERVYNRPEALEGLKESIREELALDFLKQGAKMLARKDQQGSEK